MLYVISYNHFSDTPIDVKTTDRFAFVDEICRMTRKSCGDVAYWVDKLSAKAAESDSGMADDCAANDTFIFAIAENGTAAERANLNGLKLDETPDIKELEGIREKAAKAAIKVGKPAPCYQCGCFEPELYIGFSGQLNAKQDFQTLEISCPRCRYKIAKDAVYKRGKDKAREAAVVSARKELIAKWNRAWSWNKTVNGR